MVVLSHDSMTEPEIENVLGVSRSTIYNMRKKYQTHIPHPLVQFHAFVNGVHFPAFVARLLHHAKDSVVSLNLIVGALAVFPPQKDDHVVKLVFLQAKH